MGELLGTYHKLRRRSFIHITVWIVILIISVLISYITSVVEPSVIWISLASFTELIALIASIIILINLVGILFSADSYLDIYEDGMQIRRSGIGLMMRRNGTVSYRWNELGSYRMSTKYLSNSQRYTASPDPISLAIIKIGLALFRQTKKGVEYSLTISFSMKDGHNYKFADYRGDNLREFTNPILPERIKDKRRIA